MGAHRNVRRDAILIFPFLFDRNECVVIGRMYIRDVWLDICDQSIP